MKFSLIVASLLPLAARAGWITYQNEGKKSEGIPCVGSVYGNDNWLVSQFDFNAPDWNGTMCDMKCFPISSTTCIGSPASVRAFWGSTAAQIVAGLTCFKAFATPMKVQPVPTAATHPSTGLPYCSRISGPVVVS